MILERRRLRLTAKMLGRKPVRFRPASILSRVLPRTESGSAKYFDTVGRERPTVAAKSSMVAIFFGATAILRSPAPDNTSTTRAPGCGVSTEHDAEPAAQTRDVQRPSRVDIEQRVDAERPRRIGQRNQFRDVRGAKMTGVALAEPRTIALADDLPRRMAPGFRDPADAGPPEMVLQHLGWLESEPGIDHDRGIRWEIGDQGEDRLIARLAELPVMVAVA